MGGVGGASGGPGGGACAGAVGRRWRIDEGRLRMGTRATQGTRAAGVAGAEEDSRGESKMTVVVGSFVSWAGGAFFFGDS